MRKMHTFLIIVVIQSFENLTKNWPILLFLPVDAAISETFSI